MLLMPPDPDAPVYESVRTGSRRIETDVAARIRAEEIGYHMAQGLVRFREQMVAFSSGFAKAQAEIAALAAATQSEDVPDEESDEDDHYA